MQVERAYRLENPVGKS